MDDDGPGVRRGRGLHAPDEGQQPRGVVGDAMLRPRGEVELADLMPGRVASLRRQSQSLPGGPPDTRQVSSRPGEHLTAGSRSMRPNHKWRCGRSGHTVPTRNPQTGGTAGPRVDKTNTTPEWGPGLAGHLNLTASRPPRPPQGCATQEGTRTLWS